MDLLSLRSFTKLKVRKSIDNTRFTHWLPLYFGEKDAFEVTLEKWNEKEKNHEYETKTVEPRERLISLLKHSLCFIARGSTKKELNADMVIEIMPRLIITHMVDLASGRKHMSILAIRRLINFIRLFRLAIELVPGVMPIITERLRIFRDEEAKRVKDFTPNLGDILAFSLVCDTIKFDTIRDAYIQEQLDR